MRSKYLIPIFFWTSSSVLPRCVAFLKFYLLQWVTNAVIHHDNSIKCFVAEEKRCFFLYYEPFHSSCSYIPKVSTLRQIDLFCANSIADCESANIRRIPDLSKSPTQHSKTSSSASNAYVPSLPTSNFASASLIKSLNYVRSLVARHTPKLSFQPVLQSVTSTAAKHLLPSLSSLLSKSFNSHLSSDGLSSKDTLENKELSGPSPSGSASFQDASDGEVHKYMFSDILKWRWPGEGSYIMKERYFICISLSLNHNFLHKWSSLRWSTFRCMID